MSATALADVVGVTPGTVRRHLATLAEHGLAERTEDGYVRTSTDPIELEEDLGVAGMTEAQRIRHNVERRLRQRALAERAVAVESPPFVVDADTGEIVPVEALSKRPPADARQAAA